MIWRTSGKRHSKLAQAQPNKESLDINHSQTENPVRRGINGLNTIAGDLNTVAATRTARLKEQAELEAKFAELEELIRATRKEIEQKNNVIKLPLR
jgi:hypothetical protein